MMNRVAKSVPPFALLLGALFYCWTALASVANYALRYPAFDLYREYLTYLRLPFPANVVQLDNGHRPALPTLVRLAEIRWFHADQMLQVAVGTAAAILSFVLIAWVLLRERRLSWTNRTAGLLLAAVALFWLGNARMLMQGSESLHVHFVILATILGALTLNVARRSHSLGWLMVAGACCLAATFSFGTGIAAFIALLVVAAITRFTPRSLALLGGVFAGTLVLYLFVLPGHNGVRYSLLVDPAGNAAVLLRWLAAPWINAWFGLADPPLIGWMQDAAFKQPIGHALVVSARLAALPWGADWMARESVALGALGALGYCGMLAHAWRAGSALSATRVLAIALATFALGSAAIVCLARLHGFSESPNQVFAERYLPWSCLFWLGLALYACTGKTRSALCEALIVAIPALLMASIFYPSHCSWAGWSATVHWHNQQSAVAAQLGIWDPERFPDDDSASRDDVLSTLELLKARRLSMFDEPGFSLLEKHWHAPAPDTPELPGAHAYVDREFDDAPGHLHFASFLGTIPRTHFDPRTTLLAVTDSAGALRGLAKFSFVAKAKSRLHYRLLPMRGFTGYVLTPAPGEHLRILVLDRASLSLRAEVPLTIPVPNRN